jgi:muconolactone delta-isomerase
MLQFMIDIVLPRIVTQEFISLIPNQRAEVNRLIEEGKIIAYTLTLTRSKLWAIVVADDEEEVLEILSFFPLLKFMRFDIHPLAFHQSISLGMPMISLN